MGVVRIDDEIQKKLEEFLGEGDNKYKYPSLTSFVNNAVLEKIKKENGKETENN